VIAAPKDEVELFHLLQLGVNYQGVFALRYPRASIPSELNTPIQSFQIGEGEEMTSGNDLAILALGSMVLPALQAAELLKKEGLKATVCNMRFAWPLDETLLKSIFGRTRFVFTVEEHVLAGGFGAKVLEFAERWALSGVSIKRFALPNEFIEHGQREELLERFGLSAHRLAEAIRQELRPDAHTGQRSSGQQ